MLHQPRYLISDFVEIQRVSFFNLLKKGIIDEFSKRNPMSSTKKEIEVYFYPEYYRLVLPPYSERGAISNSKSYASRIYIPTQLSFRNSQQIRLKWIYVGDLPLMTKRGHFILNGAPRVIMNQIIRSPGIYYQEIIHEASKTKKYWETDEKPPLPYKRYYADLICLSGTWLRLEIDKEKNIWAQTKKGVKMPLFWFLIGLGLSERLIVNSIINPERLFQNLCHYEEKKKYFDYVSDAPLVWKEIFQLIYPKKDPEDENAMYLARKWFYTKFMSPKSYDLSRQGRAAFNKKLGLNIDSNQLTLTPFDLLHATDYLLKVEKGLNEVDDIDHLKNRRVRTSGELVQIQIALGISRLEKNVRIELDKIAKHFFIKSKSSKIKSKLDFKENEELEEEETDLDSTDSYLPELDLKEIRKFQTELFSPGQNNKIKKTRKAKNEKTASKKGKLKKAEFEFDDSEFDFESDSDFDEESEFDFEEDGEPGFELELDFDLEDFPAENLESKFKSKFIQIDDIIDTKPFNSALREFFGSSPLSQFMDQINPLAELTHKRRLSSMGPGGVSRDSATLAIRGIHPTHYGRICGVETPEGKNTGLVNSLTTYARVNSLGLLESPFYKVYKGIVLKNVGLIYFSADQEEKIKLAAPDLLVSSLGFLPNTNLPVRIGNNFAKAKRHEIEYIGISPLQMISIATSLIPFLEHDDGNRALMGSNMQRQAVPLLQPERPIVGTGLESRAVSDVGHIVQAKFSGMVTYVSARSIRVLTLKNNAVNFLTPSSFKESSLRFSSPFGRKASLLPKGKKTKEERWEKETKEVRGVIWDKNPVSKLKSSHSFILDRLKLRQNNSMDGLLSSKNDSQPDSQRHSQHHSQRDFQRNSQCDSQNDKPPRDQLKKMGFIDPEGIQDVVLKPQKFKKILGKLVKSTKAVVALHDTIGGGIKCL
jgi:DNA-directed RNA polymerase subunit beta